MPQLLLATHNKGKIAEFQALLAGSGWDLVTPADIGLTLDVKETGNTYLDNARLKARAFALTSGLPSLADDSGLEVDALAAQPGPLHHVLGWDGANNDERIRILLERLAGVPDRRARFRAVIVVAFPDGAELIAEGACEGSIATAPSGEAGFGYDPVFIVEGSNRTMAQLTSEEKNRISHRARAAQALLPQLRSLSPPLRRAERGPGGEVSA
jgi:XTP/dITP diphosphohydrolase